MNMETEEKNHELYNCPKRELFGLMRAPCHRQMTLKKLRQKI